MSAPPSDPIENLVEKLNSGNFKNVLVLTGAGISTSAGIPDFRSPKIGLYASLKSASHFQFRSPTFVFDIGVFKKDPKPFWWVFCNLWPKQEWPSPTDMHFLIGFLNKKGILKRVYTQNVDSLEIPAGLPADKLVQCHGTLSKAHCYDCRHEVEMSNLLRQIQPNLAKEDRTIETTIVPHCPHCGGEHVKPDVTFFGEALPARFSQTLSEDFSECDLLICSGTSLEVFPFASLIGHCKEGIPRYVINKDPVREKGGMLKSAWNFIKTELTFGLFNFNGDFDYGNGLDFFIGGDLQDAARAIVEKAGWKEEFDAYKESCKSIQDPLKVTASQVASLN